MIDKFPLLLIDLNEWLHHMQYLPEDKFVTANILLMTLLASPFILMLLNYITKLDREMKYIPYFIIGFMFFSLYIIKAYGAIFISILFCGFLGIVVLNPKYKHLKDYIDRFF